MDFAKSAGLARWFQEWAYVYTTSDHADEQSVGG